jgi:signal transduction histidine kinase
LAATEILGTLLGEQSIVRAILYDSTGSPFAQFPIDFTGESILTGSGASGYAYVDEHLEGNFPVILGENQIGLLYLKSDLRAWDQRLQLYRWVVLFVLVISIIIAWVLSRFLSRSISAPIIALSETATAISVGKDYSVRAKKEGNDEMGFLTDAFNEMLEQIQTQNRKLSKFNKSLEQKVNERTLELNVALKEQQEAESEINKKNVELSHALKELQKTKEKLIELNNDLELRVETRTMELRMREKELETKNDELEKVNFDLDNFVYTASHDLKSPISNLEALIVVIKEELAIIASPTHFRFLDMMETSIMKLRKTILDLAEITKVQKNIDNDAEQVSFQKIIEEVKEDILFGYKDLEIIINDELEVDHFFYPAKGLRSILYNLISNAIKFRSPERTSQIKLKTYLEAGSVVLWVEDNGLGIEERHFSKLFSMFKRFHNHVDGTGIGLYIIKRTVENRGGRIEFISKGDQGSIFKVYFSE